MSSIPDHCLNSPQGSLSLNFTSRVHLIIFISVRCNANSFSLFSDHMSLPYNIQLRTHASWTYPRNNSEIRGQWPKLKPTTANPGSHSSFNITIQTEYPQDNRIPHPLFPSSAVYQTFSHHRQNTLPWHSVLLQSVWGFPPFVCCRYVRAPTGQSPYLYSVLPCYVSGFCWC